MQTGKDSTSSFREEKVSIKFNLAALWTSIMFFYLYVDLFALYMPGKIEGILKNKVFVFDINQEFLLAALLSMSIPTLMIFMCVALPAKINRLVNLIVAGLYIPYSLFNVVGETWWHIFYAAVIEVVLLCLILRYAWKWPRIE